MAAPTLTYMLTNGSTADADQVMQNFNDLKNGYTDGTKDLTFNELTANGAATFNGHVTLGNGTPDDITVSGSLAASIAVKTTYSYDLGSSTIGWKSFYFGSADSAARTTRVIGGTVASSITLTLPSTATGTILATNNLTNPTIQTFTSGSGTYTKPAGVLYIRVRMVGGGGGGAGSALTANNNGSNGGNGGNTTFGSSLLVANGGNGGVYNGAGGTGGTASLGSGPIGTAIQGTPGGGSAEVPANTAIPGGWGGSSPLGGAGSSSQGTGGGTAAITNSGSGGGGSGCNQSSRTGGGGGSGGWVDAIITCPSATYAYAVGAAGTAGANGTGGGGGGAGGSGYIEVTEYYQ